MDEQQQSNIVVARPSNGPELIHDSVGHLSLTTMILGSKQDYSLQEKFVVDSTARRGGTMPPNGPELMHDTTGFTSSFVMPADVDWLQDNKIQKRQMDQS